ncbi:MAG: Methyltransferase type 11 [Actinomycetia bacterium]|nr:Methyltransferase type 11 [Actinomycetes bacterium]
MPRPEGRACPACGSTTAAPLGAQDGFTWVRCRTCATCFVDHLPSEAATADFFADYGRTPDDVPAIVARRSREILAPLDAYRRTGRLLEVGFGSGVMLQAAADLGWECWGVELSEVALQAAAGRGWTTFRGELTDVDLPDGGFDVVLLVETIEHLRRPDLYLARVASLLRPGGALFGTTPNGRSVTARLLGLDWSVFAAPDHIQLFSRPGLRELLGGAGLEPRHVRAQGVNPSVLRAGLRRGPVAATDAPDRVGSAYELNERLSGSTSGRLLKAGANAVLDPLGLGDSLKFLATRPGA